MAVFSKFAVSVAVVAVGYEEERCETASALQVESSAASRSIPPKPITVVPSVAQISGGQKDTSKFINGSLQAQFSEKKDKHKGYGDIGMTVRPAAAIPSKDTMQLLVAELKAKLTGENLKELTRAFWHKQQFDKALEGVEECTEREKESLYKMWEFLRCAEPGETAQFWEKIEANAQKNKEMIVADKCNLTTIANRLETYLCKMLKRKGSIWFFTDDDGRIGAYGVAAFVVVILIVLCCALKAGADARGTVA